MTVPESGNHVPDIRSAALRRFLAVAANASLVVISLALALAAAELYLRYTDFRAADLTRDPGLSTEWNDPDDLLGFVRRPFVKWEGKAYPDKFAPFVTANTDENGFRNPPGITQAEVAFLGDSFTEGGSMTLEHTFPRLIEKSTGKSIVNLARSSYGPPQELTVLWKYALQYKPKSIVWVIFEGNDLMEAQISYKGSAKVLNHPANTNWSAMGTLWFDDLRLHELAPPPGGDDWYYRSASIMNISDRLPERFIVGENLMRNGGFENEITKGEWEITESIRDAVVRERVSDAPEGDYALKIHVSSSTNIGLAQIASRLKPGTTYLYSGWIRTDDVLVPTRLEVQQKDADKYALLRFTPGIPAKSGWTHSQLVFTTPQTPGEVRVFLRRPSGPPPAREDGVNVKLLELLDVLRHQQDRIRAYWGLVGTFDSTAYGKTEVGFRYKIDTNFDQLYPQGWKVTAESIQRGKEICSENGIRLLILYVPIKLRVLGPYTTFPPDSKLGEYAPGGVVETDDEFEKRLAAFCSDHSIDYLDATRALRDAASKGEMVYSPRYDTHLYYRGNEIVAEAIAQWLEQN
ncbi:MAG: hypothetical protein AMXMBFR84_13000 [Candidatus Hydrogenedentota bacterium]